MYGVSWNYRLRFDRIKSRVFVTRPGTRATFPKLLLHIFKEQNTHFQTKLAVFWKAMYQDPF